MAGAIPPQDDPPDAGGLAAPAPPVKPSSLRRLAALAAAVPSRADLVLLGDSLVASWPEADLVATGLGREPFNFGLPGDRIANTLWRLDAVPTGHLRPRAVVVLLGTNNLGDGDAARAIAAGLAVVARRAVGLWSPATLVVVGLPWRRPGGVVRDAARHAVNAALSGAIEGPGRHYVDPDPLLGDDAESTQETVSSDGLHLAADAYRRLSRALAERLVG